MENSTVQAFFGSLTKEETLYCIESNLIIKDSCVLESKNPFLGYFNDTPQIEKPRYLYLMLGQPLSFIEAARIINQVSIKSSYTIDAVLAEITLPGHPNMPALRLRDLPQYGQISLVQQEFKDAGMIFRKHQKGLVFENALITLEKFFYLKMHETAIYFDARQAHHGYFIIPDEVTWQDFKKLTQEVKYDPQLLSFDAARATIYSENKLIELIRIYRNNIDLEFMKKVRDRYFQLLKI